MPGDVRVLSSGWVGATEEIVPCVVMLARRPDPVTPGKLPDDASVSGTDERGPRLGAVICPVSDVSMRPEFIAASACPRVRATRSIVCGRWLGSFSMQLITS